MKHSILSSVKSPKRSLGLCLVVLPFILQINLATAQTVPDDLPDQSLELTQDKPVFDPQSLNLVGISGNILQFKIPKINAKLPSARFGTRDLLVIDSNTEWLVLVALEQNMLPGDYIVYFSYDDANSEAISIGFSVNARTNTSAVDNPNQNAKQAPIMTFTWPQKLSLLDFENSTEPNIPFYLPSRQLEPVQTIVKRIKSPTVEANALGSNIENQDDLLAPSQGIVANLVESETQATMLILDHGRSMFSIFAFWGQSKVDIGTGVKQGQLLAKLGKHEELNKSGPKTLFWWVSLNGTIVNPQVLVDWRTQSG